MDLKIKSEWNMERDHTEADRAVLYLVLTLFGETNDPLLLHLLQEQNLHSGQRPGDLHRQGNGFEQRTHWKQRKWKVWTVDPSTNFLLDFPATLTPLAPPSPSAYHHIVHGDGDNGGDDEGHFFVFLPLISRLCFSFSPVYSMFLLRPNALKKSSTM